MEKRCFSKLNYFSALLFMLINRRVKISKHMEINHMTYPRSVFVNLLIETIQREGGRYGSEEEQLIQNFLQGTKSA